MKAAFLLSAPYEQASIDAADAGALPRPDYLLLTRAIGADLLTPVEGYQSPIGKFRTFLRLTSVAWHGFRKRKEYDVIISDQERVGLILALLLRLSRSRTRHVMICHAKVISRLSLLLIRIFGLNNHIDRYVCYGPQIAKVLEDRFPETREKLKVIYHPADHRFWRPLDMEPECLVTVAGMLNRDFDTFIEAVKDLDVKVYLAGFSPWVSSHISYIKKSNLPDNVQVGKLSPSELREKFNRSLFVAVPLYESDGQDGSLVVYEAMATGKAIAVSRTRGQQSLGAVNEGINGCYVDIGDVAGWRRVVRWFMDNPGAASRMGKHSRKIVEDDLNLEKWTAEFAETVCGIPMDSRR